VVDILWLMPDRWWRLTAVFVVPRLVRLARLHCRGDACESRLGASSRENTLHYRLFVDIALAKELALKPVSSCEPL
jgi:hypothetical protein